ncbi:MAG: histidine kinase [Ekhidna sp.]
MKKIFFLLFLITFLMSPSFGQNEEYLDSLNQVVKDLACTNPELSDSLISVVLEAAFSKDYTIQIGYAYNNAALNFICEDDYRRAIEKAKESIDFFRRAKYGKGEADATYTIAAAYRKLHRNDSALLYSRRILGIANANQDITIEAAAYFNLSGVFIESHQNDSALYYSLKALKIADNPLKDVYFLPGIVHNLAISYNQGGALEKAKETFLRAEKLYQEYEYRKGRPSSLYSAIGRCYLRLEKYDSAIIFYKKGMIKAEEINNDFMLAILSRSIGKAYWEKGDIDKAVSFGLAAKKISERASLDGNLAVVLSQLTLYYTELGDYPKAIRYGKAGLITTEKTNNLGVRTSILSNLSAAYEKSSDLVNSLAVLKEKIEVDKKLQEEVKAREFAHLEVEYETEKKEAEIAMLSQKSSIQTLEIKQKNQAIMIGVIVILFVLAAIYFIYKQQEIKKQQSQTELEQRFLRSQLNPHFISNALVAVQSFMLNNDSESAALYLTKFSKLMREILENSRKEFIPVEEEVSMLRNYLDIHKLRLGSFDFAIELDENIDSATDTIPPMFVQPFVENAVEHGISDLTEGGRIDLIFRKEGDYISIEVNDNGKGLQKNNSEGHTSLSTTIIKERMEIFNRSLKKKIKLIIDNLKNDEGKIYGTKVELKVPFI